MKLPSYAPGVASRGVSSLLVRDAPHPASPVPSPVASASARAHIRYFGVLGGDVFGISNLGSLDDQESCHAGRGPGRCFVALRALRPVSFLKAKPGDSHVFRVMPRRAARLVCGCAIA